MLSAMPFFHSCLSRYMDRVVPCYGSGGRNVSACDEVQMLALKSKFRDLWVLGEDEVQKC